MTYAVIMAGGVGTRFWPKSTKALPKQFLNLFGERTMIRNTVDRIESLIPLERVLVVTNDRYVDMVKEQLPGLPEQNVVGEPVGRNTAPCVAIAAQMLAKKDPEATMIVLPADHQITDEGRFLSVLKAAVEKAESGDALVTIGIEPDRPETGYGYIHADRDHSDKASGETVYRVKAFTEKPDEDTAQRFVESGDYFWNSGMFIWRASVILDAFKKFLPEIHELLLKAESGLWEGSHEEKINDFYHACPSISVDYGIMEHADEVFVVPGEFGWNDVGSWSAIYDLGQKDTHGNVIQASPVVQTDASNNLVVSSGKKVIALAGVEGLAVVETDDAILICPIEKAQLVKEVVNELDENDETRRFI